MDTLPLNVLYRKLGIPYQDISAQQEEIEEKLQQIAERAEVLYGNLENQISANEREMWKNTDAPLSSFEEGQPKSFAADSRYFYVCPEDGHWKRIPLRSI